MIACADADRTGGARRRRRALRAFAGGRGGDGNPQPPATFAPAEDDGSAAIRDRVTPREESARINAADWIDRVGPAWADEWRRTDRSFAGLSPMLDAAILAPAPERIAFRYVAGEGEGAVADTVGYFARIGPPGAALAAAPADRPALRERLVAVCAAYRHDGRVAFPAVTRIWTARNERSAR